MFFGGILSVSQVINSHNSSGLCLKRRLTVFELNPVDISPFGLPCFTNGRQVNQGWVPIVLLSVFIPTPHFMTGYTKTTPRPLLPFVWQRGWENLFNKVFLKGKMKILKFKLCL
jgi:hypothetical protein